ncbi:uncharacterized protein BDW70DRAFT_147325 [Aspergillus foveolatus]|uniref:uncharacterized protein n=1 Tax=Aspergillus foveolatus TaxID=210207 RepID=UPI003CCDF51F
MCGQYSAFPLVPPKLILSQAACVSTALRASSCDMGDTACLCTTPTAIESALGCYSLQCTVKEALCKMACPAYPRFPLLTSAASTNMTRSTCGVPEESEANLTPALAGSLGMLALVMVGLRIGWRTATKKTFGWDDGFILLAMPDGAVKYHGLGTNLWTIPFDSITAQLKYLLIAEVFYMPAEAFTQLSFLAFYQRIFPPKYKYPIYTLSAISVCFGISNTLIMIFQCTPVSFFWNSWTGEVSGTCIDISTYSWYRAAMQICMDVSIISLPIWPLSRLALSTRKKAMVLVMFSTGFLPNEKTRITIVSCLRLQSLIKFSKSPNTSMDNNPAIYWSMVECDVAIICACMPCLPPLLKPIFPRCFATTQQSDPEEERTPQPVRLNQIMKKDEFSVLSSSASGDRLVA